MSPRDKLVRRIVARPPEANFNDVRLLLEAFGWTLARQKGSHATFVQPGANPITVPIHSKKVGRVYLDHICEQLGLDELED